MTRTMNSKTWLITALIISLGVNLLIVGVVIGRVISAPIGPPHHFNWMMEEVDEQTRDKLRSSIRKNMKATRPMRQGLRSAQRDLHEAIATEPFDKQQISKSFEQLRLQSSELQEAMHQQMLNTLGQLEPEERMRVFRALSRPRSRGEKPRHEEHPRNS